LGNCIRRNSTRQSTRGPGAVRRLLLFLPALIVSAPTRAPRSDSPVDLTCGSAVDKWDRGNERDVIVRSPETIFSFFELLLSSPLITLECVRLRSQGGHKPYFGVAGSPYSLNVRMLREPRPARLLWLVPGGGVEPPRPEGRRILRASKSLTLQYCQLRLSASDAVSTNIELPPSAFQICRLRSAPVTTASQASRFNPIGKRYPQSTIRACSDQQISMPGREFTSLRWLARIANAVFPAAFPGRVTPLAPGHGHASSIQTISEAAIIKTEAEFAWDLTNRICAAIRPICRTSRIHPHCDQ
jgi:hypothetical protein